jgi:sec-independent protein translocase protein TatA
MHSSVLLFFSNLFSTDMVIIVFIALLLFGGEKLPEIARGLGKGIRDFKDASEGVKREINNQINNFEEKREEKKLDEAALIHQQQAEQPSSTTVETGTAASIIKPATNSVPVGDSHHFGQSTNIETNDTTALHTEHVAESHSDVSNTETGTAHSETINNSK